MKQLNVGSAKGDITPPSGATMDGYSNRIEPSRGVHDRLSARVLFFEDGENSLALISCDVCWFSDQTIREIKKELNKNEINQVLIFATHNHSGPSMTDLIVSPNESALKYVETVPSIISEITNSAVKNTVQVVGVVGRRKARLTFNRRKPHGGPIDPEIITALLKDRSDKPVAALVNYACHPTVQGSKNLLISSDWPGRFVSKVDETVAEDFVTVFLNGPCGDILPIRENGSFSDIDRMAAQLCRKSMQSLSNNSRVETDSGIDCKILTIGPLPPFGITLDLSAVAIGDFVILAVPGEVFASTGLALKESSGTENFVVASYANGYRGYFPTQDAYARKDYETGPLCWVDSSAEAQIRMKGAILSNSVLQH